MEVAAPEVELCSWKLSDLRSRYGITLDEEWEG